jgi:catechol-2,3-dioxygenase
MLRVGHVGLSVADLDQSIAFAESIVGLRVSERDSTAAYLTCNARHHELVLLQGDGEQTMCDHIAFEAMSEETYTTLIARIESEDLPIVARGVLEPGIEDAIRFVAPGGFTIEVFYGMARDEPPHYDSVAPRPDKFEHITLKSTDRPALEDLFTRVLGLRLSDRAGDRTSWLRASDEHHGVSVIGDDVNALHHYAWQFGSFAVLGEVGDHLMNHGHTFLWGPGHHGIGDNYFCYFNDSDGVIVEYSAGIQRIENEETYSPRVWEDSPLTVNRWGNPPPPPEFESAATPLVSPARAEPVS